jgi:single-stranded-DNA-specific exonuclease
LVTISPLSGARWEIAPQDLALEQVLMDELGLAPVLARTLVGRGMSDPGIVEKFLNPSEDQFNDPALLPDYRAAVDLILAARDSKDLIFIHGDYDVDGVSSAALLSRFLGKIGCNVHTHVPHRMKEGYGIHTSVVDTAQELGAKLFLTCDCGSSALEQIKKAKALGMKVLVTDHHELKEEWPEADAFVNPHRPDSKYPFAVLCGAGVAFKLCEGIAKEAGFKLHQFYRAYLDLATLGTVSDVMPLVNENRIIVALGLQHVASSNKAGIKALVEKTSKSARFTARTIGFQLGPRLNAAGRLDDASISLALLLTNDMDEARAIAEQLDFFNEQRKAETQRMIREAQLMIEKENMLDHPVLVVGGEDWHPGIIGNVASKLVESYYRPAFVVSLEHGKGSARSISGYHLADALNRTTKLLKSHGGHEMAAGFALDPKKVPEFREALQADAGATISAEQLIRRLHIDAIVKLSEVTVKSLGHLTRMEPFGQANPEPVFMSEEVTVEKIMPTSNPDHFRVVLRDPETRESVKAMAFGMPQFIAQIKEGNTISAAYTAEIDTYGGNESVKLTIKDLAVQS